MSQSVLTLVSQAQSYQASIFCQLAASALVLYEHVATFSQEVQLMWFAKTSLATVLFFINRYVLLLSATLSMLEVFNVSRNARKVLLVSQGICVIVSLATWAVFVMFRVYVMTARKWRPTILSLLLGLVPFAVNLAALAESCVVPGLAPDIGPNIGFVLKAPLVTSHIFAILARASSILSDALVLVITFFGIQNVFTRAHTRMSRPLTSLVRYGMLYFIALLLLNCLDMALYFTGIIFFHTLPFAAILDHHVTVPFEHSSNTRVSWPGVR